MGNSKLESVRGSIVNKLRNSRELFDKLSFFQKIYLDQMSFVDDLFTEWPYESGQEGKIVEVAKRDVLKNMGKEEFGESEMVCIFEEYYGHKYRNY